jgi:formate-dependent nitrite reductase membrane component NrfD
MIMADYLWLIVLIVGPIILGALIAFGMMERRKLSNTERNMRDAKTRKLYLDNSDM